jgi:hypothetical protein
MQTWLGFLLVVICGGVGGALLGVSVSIDQLRKSLERDTAKTQNLLAEIRDKLTKSE